jgi:hypothetical protein
MSTENSLGRAGEPVHFEQSEKSAPDPSLSLGMSTGGCGKLPKRLQGRVNNASRELQRLPVLVTSVGNRNTKAIVLTFRKFERLIAIDGLGESGGNQRMSGKSELAANAN